jgi:signal transduction histidine kinase
VSESATPSQNESRRAAEAHDRGRQRIQRQRDTLRPLGWAALLVVGSGAFNGDPRPGWQGRPLGVTLALGAFAVTLAMAIGPGFTGGAAVWMAVARLPLAPGIAIGGVTAAALDVTAALTGSSPTAILATTLLLALLGLVAWFIKQARASQDRTELLLAQLEDARDEQTRAATVAERSRIAGELHDVLAHSLSGAAIQLQAARKLAEREGATTQMRNAIERAGALVKDGLGNARQAVGALRGETLPGVADLEPLITGFRNDMAVDAVLTIEGSARALSAEAGLALYRGAQEALTNIARYAPGAATTVVRRYGRDRTILSVEDHFPLPSTSTSGNRLNDAGGGHGLAGMRERIERIGGTAEAGPVDSGWRVEMVVPA